jgi:hypothetical protein
MVPSLTLDAYRARPLGIRWLTPRRSGTFAGREAPLSDYTRRARPAGLTGFRDIPSTRRSHAVSTHDITPDRGASTAHGRPTRSGALRRLTTETKAAFKTTEFYAFLAVLAGLLVAGNTIEGKDGGADYFAADKVWLYVTLLTIGYLISRGLAKAGSRDPYWDEHGARNASR